MSIIAHSQNDLLQSSSIAELCTYYKPLEEILQIVYNIFTAIVIFCFIFFIYSSLCKYFVYKYRFLHYINPLNFK